MSDTGKQKGIEKRIHPRKTLRTQVVFEDETGEGFIYFYSTDISLGGIFLESDIPLKQGTRVFLSFSLGDARQPLRVTAQVVRIEKQSHSTTPVIGMGVQFVDLPEPYRKAIYSFIIS